ncbi:MAG TPA: Fe-S cluster assembly protein SufD [Caulobacteraceae bacterium]|jgi:Fe-S cluster assembly protein SufD
MSLASALRANDPSQLPSRRDEDWRWTDLRALLRVLPPPSPAVASVAANLSVELPGARQTVFANGRLLGEAGAARGVVVRRFVAATAQTSHHVEAPIAVAAGETLVLIDSFEGQAADYVRDAATPITVGPNASVERIVLLDDAADAVSVALTEVHLAPGARFAQTVLTTGARRQRFETGVAHPGQGASVRLDGLYLLDGQTHADATSEVVHDGRDGLTSQLTKGVVSGQGRGVFQGRIVVRPGADGTDARMGHHALILGERAEVDAKPELEIYADDVSCAHGNTVGALDEAALFYMRQRGMPDGLARRVLTEAFLNEVVDRIEHDGARDVARAWLAERLAR